MPNSTTIGQERSPYVSEWISKSDLTNPCIAGISLKVLWNDLTSGSFKIFLLGDFPGGTMDETPCFQGRWHGFDPW